MSGNNKAEEFLFIDNKAEFDYDYHAGDRLSRFFHGLKDKQIWANVCPKCGYHSCPPRVMCGHCDEMMTDWVRQGEEGELVSFNVRYYEYFHPRQAKMVEVPWADVTVRLDGKACMISGLIPPDPAAHKVGDRYRVVWNETRTGCVDDILHFEKVPEDSPPTSYVYKVADAPPPLKEYLAPNAKLHSPFKKWYGSTLTKFFKTIRDDKKITATVCKKCNKTYCTPKTICPDCFERLNDYTDLSGEGTIVGKTVVRYTEPAQPYPAPYVIAIIKLDGADNTLNHVIGGINPDDVKVGMRVKPEFKVDRIGNILDIKYFKPII